MTVEDLGLRGENLGSWGKWRQRAGLVDGGFEGLEGSSGLSENRREKEKNILIKQEKTKTKDRNLHEREKQNIQIKNCCQEQGKIREWSRLNQEYPSQIF